MEAKKKNLEKLKASKNDSSNEETAEPSDNLGLDSDHSSETAYQYLNNDNDMISENPEGEEDVKSNSSVEGYSPLNDK